MTLRLRIIRVGIGLAILMVVLIGLFAVTLPAIHRWGATDSELALALPGDDLIVQPLLQWTHGVTINAPPEQVWPWIAQLGDTRGGYYSYTFIENQVGALTGAADYNVVYVNADRIHPEWQNPQPGDSLIQSVLKVREVKTGEYLLADSITPETMNWVWLWHLQPINNSEQTRLLVRFGIDVPGQNDNPVMGFIFDVGGFVMEQNMLQGIKTRAEGGSEPSWIEPVEIGLWMAALLAGLVAAGLFVFQLQWQKPLAGAVAAVIVLFILTFAQPDLWFRLLLNAALIAGVVWAWQKPLIQATHSPELRQAVSHSH